MHPIDYSDWQPRDDELDYLQSLAGDMTPAILAIGYLDVIPQWRLGELCGFSGGTTPDIEQRRRNWASAASKRSKRGRQLLPQIIALQKEIKRVRGTPDKEGTDAIPANVPDEQEGFLYLMQEKGSTNVKIGYGKNPERRMKSFQTGNSDELHIVYLERYPNNHDAHKRETYLHKAFYKYRIRRKGEWFDGRVVELIRSKSFSMLDAAFRQSINAMRELKIDVDEDYLARSIGKLAWLPSDFDVDPAVYHEIANNPDLQRRLREITS